MKKFLYWKLGGEISSRIRTTLLPSENHEPIGIPIFAHNRAQADALFASENPGYRVSDFTVDELNLDDLN